jgi:hypothetical protein
MQPPETHPVKRPLTLRTIRLTALGKTPEKTAATAEAA